MDDNYSNALSNLHFIDLFCGIGGFHLALSSFGAKCVFASDINQAACEVYQNNFHLIPKGDITKIHAKDIPAHEILCAGFPCQPFSISGSQKGYDDERGKLFFDIIRIANYHRPKIMLLENVRNFEHHDGGNTLKKAIAELSKIGYISFFKVLQASDYRIPQARNRIYIVAFRNDLGISEFTFPVKCENFRVLNDFLIDEQENQVPGNYLINRDYTLTLSDNGERSNQLCRIGKIGLGRQGERIYSVLGQSITLSSQGGGLGGKTGMYLINDSVRKLYPRECARLMGFPDNFRLSSSQEQNYRQFGNSVVVDVLQYIIKEIVQIL